MHSSHNFDMKGSGRAYLFWIRSRLPIGRREVNIRVSLIAISIAIRIPEPHLTSLLSCPGSCHSPARRRRPSTSTTRIPIPKPRSLCTSLLSCLSPDTPRRRPSTTPLLPHAGRRNGTGRVGRGSGRVQLWTPSCDGPQSALRTTPADTQHGARRGGRIRQLALYVHEPAQPVAFPIRDQDLVSADNVPRRLRCQMATFERHMVRVGSGAGRHSVCGGAFW